MSGRGAPDLESRCRDEVVSLHRFFERWMGGVLDRTEDAFERVRAALAPEFEMLTRVGVRLDRDRLLESVWENHGTREGFAIGIRDVRVRALGDGYALATYQEWQTSPDGEDGRLSTALFRVDDAAPGGVVWVHVHESGIETGE